MSARLTPAEGKVVSELISKVVSDLNNGKDKKNSGWVKEIDLNSKDAFIGSLESKGFIERSSKGIKLRLNMLYSIQKTPMLSLQVRQALFFLNDLEVVNEELEMIDKSQKLVSNAEDLLKKDKQALDSAVILGIFYMVSSSEMVVPTWMVLQRGFSPQEWYQSAMRAVPNLCRYVSNALSFDCSLSECSEYWSKKGLLTTPVDIIECEESISKRVASVFQWEELIIGIPRNLLIFLGLSWFFFLMFNENNLAVGESDMSAKQLTKAISIAEGMTGLESQKFELLLDEYLIKFEDSETNWLGELFHLPGVY